MKFKIFAFLKKISSRINTYKQNKTKKKLKNKLKIIIQKVKLVIPLLFLYFFLFIVANLANINFIKKEASIGFKLEISYDSIEYVAMYIVLFLFTLFISFIYFRQSIKNGAFSEGYFSLYNLFSDQNLKESLLDMLKIVFCSIIYKILYMILMFFLLSLCIVYVLFTIGIILTVIHLLVFQFLILEIIIFAIILSLILVICLFVYFQYGLFVNTLKYFFVQKYKDTFTFNNTLYIAKKYYKDLFFPFLVWTVLLTLGSLFLFEKRIYFSTEEPLSYVYILLKLLYLLVCPCILFILIPYITGQRFREITKRENISERTNIIY